MKKKPATLVIEHLEGISRTAIKRYPEIVTEFARGKSGVYALYNSDNLYYVGLAKNLRTRLHHHLRDRHAEAWNRFSIYLTHNDEHLKELESLVLRILMPKGNRVVGKFLSSKDLIKSFKKKVQNMQRRELFEITGNEITKVSKTPQARRMKGEYDTIVCPAHIDGFKNEFLTHNRWFAVRISKKIMPLLKYIAIYVTSPVHQITHYGQILSILPYKKTGKYMIKLKGRPKHVGPIEYSSGEIIQCPRLALIEKIKTARTLKEVFN